MKNNLEGMPREEKFLMTFTWHDLLTNPGLPGERFVKNELLDSRTSWCELREAGEVATSGERISKDVSVLSPTPPPLVGVVMAFSLLLPAGARETSEFATVKSEDIISGAISAFPSNSFSAVASTLNEISRNVAIFWHFAKASLGSVVWACFLVS